MLPVINIRFERVRATGSSPPALLLKLNDSEEHDVLNLTVLQSCDIITSKVIL